MSVAEDGYTIAQEDQLVQIMGDKDDPPPLIAAVPDDIINLVPALLGQSQSAARDGFPEQLQPL